MKSTTVGLKNPKAQHPVSAGWQWRMSKASAQRSLRTTRCARVLNTRLVPVAPKCFKYDGELGRMADKEDSETEARLNEQGRIVVHMFKAVEADDMDEALRIIGRYMDKYRLQVSSDVIEEFKTGRRIKDD